MRHRAPSQEWLLSHREDVLDPDLAIVDPHTHHFVKSYWTYLLPEHLADLDSGHAVAATVHVQNHQFYNEELGPRLAPVGETEFVNGIAAMAASGQYGPVRPCAGIVGYADLRLGAAVEPVLSMHRERAGPRFKGIRNVVGWHADPRVRASSFAYPQGMLADPTFGEGLRVLSGLGMSLDVYVYFTQLGELEPVLDAHPDAVVVLNHVGGVVGVGPYEGRREEVFAAWKASMTRLAERPNLRVKLGGLGMPILGFGFEDRDRPPGSEEVAEAWSPYFTTCIDLFGPGRCMFESNFPIDGASLSYRTLWNVHKRIASGASPDERRALFSGTATETYRLDPALTGLATPA